MQELQDIYRLQAFVAVVEEGSLSAAVSRLHITQPALSARLKLLEESLGCVLLERTGRGVRPTPLGRIVYGISVDILERMGHLLSTVRNHVELREGWVHLGGGAVSVSGLFPDAIYAFKSLHPDIQFTLHEQESQTVIELVRDGVVDLGIVTRNPVQDGDGDDPLSGFRVHAELADELVLVVAREAGAWGGKPSAGRGTSFGDADAGNGLPPSALNGQSMILFEEGSAIRKLIDAAFAQAGVVPKVAMTLRSAPGILRLVERGLGLGVVSRLSLRDEPRVCEVPIHGLNMTRNLAVISHVDRVLTPAASKFLEILLAQCPLSVVGARG